MSTAHSKKPAFPKGSRIARRPQSSPTRREAAALKELRRLERMCLELREQTENAERSRREILSVVSHDVRNPLSVILVSTKLLARAIPPESSARRQLEAIGRAAEEINHLVQELLDASSIEAGGITVDQEPVELEPLVRRAIEQARPLAAQKGLRLEAELPPGLPLVLGDADRIVQVVAALVSNAVKFTPKGGSISVRARVDACAARVSVTDSGPGIPMELREHVFSMGTGGRRSLGDGLGRDAQPLGEAGGGRRPLRPLGQGTGLSAFVAKGIVEAHGGRIGVESTVGSGSTFWFSLPVADRQRLDPAAAS